MTSAPNTARSPRFARSFPTPPASRLPRPRPRKFAETSRKTSSSRTPAEFVASFNRENIYLEVVRKEKPVHQILAFLEQHIDESGIIYCFSRKLVDDITVELTSRGYSALPYHAGLADEVRQKNQDLFIKDEVRIMVATIAFGMGINKPNVRFVIHHDLPKSLEQYYQEIGRAGRDGEAAHALLLYSYGDTRKIRYFMEDKSSGETKKAEEHLKAMTAYAESRTCRRQALLGWFGETLAPHAQNDATTLFDAAAKSEAARFPCCDVCDLGAPTEADATIPAQMFLSCVIRTGQRYGAAYVIDVLLGSRQKRVIENGHNKVSTWGIGKDVAKEDWFELARVLVERGYLSKDDEFGVLSLTDIAKDALAAREQILLPFAPATGGVRKPESVQIDSSAGSAASLKFPKKNRRAARCDGP